MAQLTPPPVQGVRGEIPEEAAGERVPRAGRIDHAAERKRGKREGARPFVDEHAVFSALHHDRLRP